MVLIGRDLARLGVGLLETAAAGVAGAGTGRAVVAAAGREAEAAAAGEAAGGRRGRRYRTVGRISGRT